MNVKTVGLMANVKRERESASECQVVYFLSETGIKTALGTLANNRYINGY